MLRTALVETATGKLTAGGADLLDQWDAEGESWLWLDLENEDPQHERELLVRYFALSQLAINDAQRQRHPPKFEAFDDYIFLLLRGLAADTSEFSYNVMQIALFAGKNFIITRRVEASLSIDRVWQATVENPATVSSGPSKLLYQISRAIADRYTPILLNLEERLEAIEAEVFDNPDDQLLSELTNYNGNLKKMRRTLTYQKDVFASLLHHIEHIEHYSNLHEFNDAYEQFERLASLATLYQELVVDLSNAFLSLASHRLNKIMKVLTITAVIFLPLTLLAGIYGMNFNYIPELHWKFGYFGVLSAMVVLTIAMLAVLKHKKWL